MPIMFCYIDPFVMNQQVVRLTPGETEIIFTGGLEAVCNFMAAEYKNGNYDKITLKGVLSESVADKIRMNGNNLFGLEEIDIEVLK